MVTGAVRWIGATIAMRILVFTEGTIVDDRNPDLEWTLFGDAARKLSAWRDHGATIAYLSSKRNPENIEKVKRALKKGGAPGGVLYFRRGQEDYGMAAELFQPDVIVEDDCRSIGGAEKTTFASIRSDLRGRVKSVVVPEFGGIDHLPDDPAQLVVGTS
jgi:hypothetical protein